MKIKKILRLSAEDSGGRNRTRTCDPIDVNDVLYQLSHATKYFVQRNSWLIWTISSTN